jgi:flagellar hook-associated protein 3 FlgL
VLGALNTSFDGRNLFSGAASDRAAVAPLQTLLAETGAAISGAATPADKRAALDAYFAPGGGYDSSVYGGATEDAAALTLPDGQEAPSLMRADDEGLKNLLKGLVVLAHTVDLPPMAMADWVRQGADLIASGGEAVVAEQARVGATLSALGRAEASLAEDKLIAGRTLDRIVGRDVFEAASETQALEQRLQAAYTLTSRIGRLSLTNFLR